MDLELAGDVGLGGAELAGLRSAYVALTRARPLRSSARAGSARSMTARASAVRRTILPLGSMD